MADNTKPFDQAFKALPEASPRGFLEAMGVLREDEEAEAELLPQELPASTLSLDTGILVRPAGQPPFVAIFESFAKFEERSMTQVLEYGKRADTRWEWDQRIYMAPLVERACPRDPPQASLRRKGAYWVGVHLIWIRPWELDAARFLRQNHPAFDSWTALCRATPQQEEEALRRLARAKNDLARFKTLAGLRYRGKEALWRAFLERIDKMITKDDLRESLAVQEWLDEGRKEGRKEGREEGREEGMRRSAEELLRVALSRYPGVAMPALPDSINVLELAKEVMLAPDEASVRLVLAAHGL